jgi:hypothetical protein
MQFFLKNSRLRSFATLAVEQIAGVHDGSRSIIHADFLNNEVVFHHEFGHETLFARTIDGNILSVLWSVLDSPPTMDEVRLSAIAATAQTLMDASFFAHEVFATYYGIKMVSPEEGQRSLAELPGEYISYYRTVADVIDPYFKCTFLQVRLALTLAHHAFSSPFAQRFVADPWSAWHLLSEDETPNLRLQALLKYLASGGIQLLREAMLRFADTFFKQERMAPWDIDDEEAWKSRPVEGYQVDLAMDEFLSKWLIEQAVVPVLPEESRKQCLETLKVAALQLGFNLETVEISTTVESLDSSATDAAQLVGLLKSNKAFWAHAHKQAASQIANPTIVSSLPHLAGRALWEVDDYRRADELHVIAGDFSEQPQVWTVISFGPADSSTNCEVNGRAGFAARFRQLEVIDWLNAGTLNSELPKVVVLPYGPKRLTGKFWSPDGSMDPGCIDSRLNERVVMYAVGNWFELIQRALELGEEVELTELVTEIVDAQGCCQPMLLKLARSPVIPGHCVMRAFGQKAAEFVRGLELRWREQSGYKFLDSAEARAAGFDFSLIERAFSGVLACWSRL